MTATKPKRRITDRGWRRLVRENWYRDLWLTVISIVLLIAVALAVDGSHRANRAAAIIQKQRVETIWTSCRQQNARHDGTIRQLDEEIAGALANASPARQHQIRASRGLTILLINQLAPKQDCVRVTIAATRSPATSPPIAQHLPPVLTNR